MLIKATNLSKSYNSIQALNSVNFEIYEGEIFGIIGPNGSGKTSTLSILLGLKDADNGTITFREGFNTKNIGAFLESSGFIPSLSVKKNFEISCLINGHSTSKNNYELLERLGIIDKAYEQYKNLSLGQKQRLAIATTFIGNPKIIVLDEPTNGLDPRGIIEIRDLILDFKKTGKTVILASHMLSEMEKVCTRVAIYNKGNIVGLDNVNDFIKQYGNLENALIKLT